MYMENVHSQNKSNKYANDSKHSVSVKAMDVNTSELKKKKSKAFLHLKIDQSRHSCVYS